MIHCMSVRIRLGPFSLSSRGRVGVRVGPFSAHGGGRRRRRRSASNNRTRFQDRQRASTSSIRQRDPVQLEAWLKAPPPQLLLPHRFTQNWFEENAASIHPGQARALVAELRSRGWSQEDIERRAKPHLQRAHLERQAIIARHKQELEKSAAKRQIEEDRRTAKEEATATRKAAKSARRDAVVSTPAKVWRRHRRSKTEDGTPTTPNASSTERCPSCGEEAMPDARFCRECGSSLSAN
jgi:ribosomal protein L32